jgi:uncharacterized protein YybS (DUF2232 family)
VKAVPETITARLRERPEPRTGGILGAALFSALLYGVALRLPLLVFLGLLAPFPLLVSRLRAGFTGGVLGVVTAAAVLGAVWSPAPALAYVLLVVPLFLITESMARGRGMVRGCVWAFVVLTAELSTALVFANPQMESAALGVFERMRSPEFLDGLREGGMAAEQVDAWVAQATASHDILQVVYPAAYVVGAAFVVLLNGGLLRLYLLRRDPGWLEAGEFEDLRWPFVLTVAFVASGAAVLSPPLRHAAYNVLLVLAFFFAVQGLAVVGYYVQRLAAPPFLRIAVLLLVLVNPWVGQILALVGLFDIWFDFRKWALPPEARGGGAT